MTSLSCQIFVVLAQENTLNSFEKEVLSLNWFNLKFDNVKVHERVFWTFKSFGLGTQCKPMLSAM